MKKYSLSQIFLLIVIASVILLAVVFGIYFDSFLKKNALDNTRKRMEHGYHRLSSDISQFERELKKGIAFLKTDRYTQSSINLINNYQNKQNYNVVLLDEEKKNILNKLLDQVKFSLNDDIVLYDQEEEFVASVSKEGEVYRLSFISYENGTKILYTKLENERNYHKSSWPQNPPMAFKHIPYYQKDEVVNSSIITYHLIEKGFVITSHQSILDENMGKVKAHIEMSRRLGDKYFKTLSEMLDIQLSLSLKKDYKHNAFQLKGIKDFEQFKVFQTEKTYYTAAKWRTKSGIVYFVATLDKAPFLHVLLQNRMQMLVILFFMTLPVLLLLHIFVKYRLRMPLEQLMQQIQKIEESDYSPSKVVRTHDELEVISNNINDLAGSIGKREAQLKASKHRMEFLSLHDPLTALPNRRFFMSHLNYAIDHSKRNGTKLAVMFLDIDQFKQLNDTMGHDIGDKLLQKVSERLLQALRPMDTLARIGGDEFNILIENVERIEDVKAVIKTLLEVFNQPFTYKNKEFFQITASIGIAIFPEDGIDGTTLIKHADMAMYQAKEVGDTHYRFFSSQLASYVQQKTLRINALKAAIASGYEFGLEYQPKISLHTGKISGVEALVRWDNASVGTIKVDEFIALAEETNLIIPLGRWIANKACSDFVSLKQSGYLLGKISINISNKQLYGSDLVCMFEEIIKTTGIDPKDIELEITESFAASYDEEGLNTFNEFRRMGIDLAIDDFGAGYSSMSYLHRLPVNRLKIDKSFIENIPVSEESIAIVQAIIGLAKIFHLSVTAEGIENVAQLDFLKEVGCDEVQGYYYAKPLDIERLKHFYSQFEESIKSL